MSSQIPTILADICNEFKKTSSAENAEYAGSLSSRSNSRKFSGSHLPSIDSAFGDSESLTPDSNSLSREDASPSELYFEEFDELQREKFSSKVKKEDSYILTSKDMKDIEHRVEEKFKEDFKRIWQDAREKEQRIKRIFSRGLDLARATLIEARVKAEKSAINRLEERAEEKQNEIMKKRSERRWQVLAGKGRKESIDLKVGNGDQWLQQHLEEMASLRKIQSDLDRARARRRNGVASMTLNKKGKLRKLMQADIRRLEKIDEIETLIQDLNGLGLHGQANNLRLTLQSKEQASVALRDKVKEERDRAKIEAWRKKEEEVDRLRLERIAEIERLEQERKAREERERRARVMAALARKAHNQAMRRGYDYNLLGSRISKPHTFTYFSPPFRKGC